MFVLIFLFFMAANAESGENCAQSFEHLSKLEKFNFEEEAQAYRDWLQKNKNATKEILSERIEKHIEKTSDHLKKLGIAHTVERGPHGALRILISPGKQTLFNRFAKGIKKYNLLNQVIYDPYQLHRQYTTAYFLNSEGIYVSLKSIIKGTPKEEAVTHESVHAFHDFQERVGKVSILHGGVRPAKRNPLLRPYRIPGPMKGYANFVSMDELITYQGSLRDSTREYLEALQIGDPKNIRDAVNRYTRNLQVFGSIQERIAAVLEYTEEAISSTDSIILNSAEENRLSFKLNKKKFEADIRGITYANLEGATSPFSEMAEITVREDASTVKPGERPLGFTFDLVLRNSKGESNSRNIMREFRKQMKDLRALLENATLQRNNVIQAMGRLEAAIQRKAAPSELETLRKEADRATGLIKE